MSRCRVEAWRYNQEVVVGVGLLHLHYLLGGGVHKNNSGNEVYCTNALHILIKIML